LIERTGHAARERRTVRDEEDFKTFLYTAPYDVWSVVLKNLIYSVTGRTQGNRFPQFIARPDVSAILPVLHGYLDLLIGRGPTFARQRDADLFNVSTPLPEFLTRYRRVKQAILTLEEQSSARDGGTQSVWVDPEDDVVDVSGLELLETFRVISALEARVVKFHNTGSMNAFSEDPFQVSESEFIRTIQVLQTQPPQALFDQLWRSFETQLRQEVEANLVAQEQGIDLPEMLREGQNALAQGVASLYQRVKADRVIVNLWEPIAEGGFEQIPKLETHRFPEDEVRLVRAGHTYFKVTSSSIVRIDPVTGESWGRESFIPAEEGIGLIVGRTTQTVVSSIGSLIPATDIFDWDTLISRRHFIVYRGRGQIHIADLSQNGTFTKRLDPSLLPQPEEAPDGGYRRALAYVLEKENRSEPSSLLAQYLEKGISIEMLANEHNFEEHHRFVASAIPELKRTGLTDLALEIPQQYQRDLDEFAETGQISDALDRYFIRFFVNNEGEQFDDEVIRAYEEILSVARRNEIHLLAIDMNARRKRSPDAAIMNRLFELVPEDALKTGDRKVLIYMGAGHIEDRGALRKLLRQKGKSAREITKKHGIYDGFSLGELLKERMPDQTIRIFQEPVGPQLVTGFVTGLGRIISRSGRRDLMKATFAIDHVGQTPLANLSFPSLVTQADRRLRSRYGEYDILISHGFPSDFAADGGVQTSADLITADDLLSLFDETEGSSADGGSRKKDGRGGERLQFIRRMKRLSVGELREQIARLEAGEGDSGRTETVSARIEFLNRLIALRETEERLDELASLHPDDDNGGPDGAADGGILYFRDATPLRRFEVHPSLLQIHVQFP